MRNKEQLKQMILQEFENQNLKANEVIMMNFWNHTFIRALNPIEQDMFAECVNELQAEGKVIYESEGMGCLRLTLSGMNDLYKTAKSVMDIEDDIMDFFRKGNYRIGQGFMLRILNSYIRSLNPIEKPLINNAIENLINKQYVRINEQQDFLYLEKEGFDYIYQ